MDTYTVTLHGLTEADRALLMAEQGVIAARRDRALGEVATALKERLAETAPRSATPGPQGRLADLFATSGVRRDGSSAEVDILNPKMVGKQRLSLTYLLTVGTRAHAIPNAFGRGLNFGTRPTFHPGTRPHPFVKEAVARLDAAPMQRLADHLAITMVGKGDDAP